MQSKKVKSNGVSDTEAVIENPEVTPAPEKTLDEARLAAFQQFVTKYQDIVVFINQLPVNPDVKRITIGKFDTGFLWGKESFNTFALPTEEVKAQDNVQQ